MFFCVSNCVVGHPYHHLHLGDLIADRFNVHEGRTLLYAIPVYLLLRGLSQIIVPHLLRASIFKPIALSKMAFTGSESATSIWWGLEKTAGPAGLIIGKSAGLFIQLLLLVIGRRISGICDIFSTESFRRMSKVAKRYINFPKYVWSALLQRLGGQLPILVFGIFFEPVIVGYFAFSRRILQEPIEVVGVGISRSYFQKSAELHRSGYDLVNLSKRLVSIMAAMVSLPMLLLGITGTDIFNILFGADWQEAGFYTQVLAPIYISTFIFRPISSLFDVLEKQKEAFLFNLLFLVTSVTTLGLGGLTGNPLLSIGLFSMGTTLLILSRMIWLLIQVGIHPMFSLSIAGRNIIRAFLFACPVFILKYYSFANHLTIVFSALLTIFVYFIYLIYFDESIRSELFKTMKASKFFLNLARKVRLFHADFSPPF